MSLNRFRFNIYKTYSISDRYLFTNQQFFSQSKTKLNNIRFNSELSCLILTYLLSQIYVHI